MYQYLIAEANHYLTDIETVVRGYEADGGKQTTASLPQIIAHRGAGLRKAMDALGHWLNEYVRGRPSASEVAEIKARVVTPIREWSSGGRLFTSAQRRRRTLPGDFEMLEAFYAGQPGGPTPAAVLFDDYYLNTYMARAVRCRLDLLSQHLAREFAAPVPPPGHTRRLLSLGVGPATELTNLATHGRLTDRIAITCVDLDTQALRHARKRINGGFGGVSHYMRANPLRYADRPDRPYPTYDRIYSVALFDHLNAWQALRLVEDCYDMLRPGGELLIGSLGAELPPHERVLMEWVLDWQPFCRSEAEWRARCAATRFAPDALRIETAQNGAVLLVIAEAQ